MLRLIARRLGEEIEARPGPLDALLELAAGRPEGVPGGGGRGPGRRAGRLAQGEEARGLGRLREGLSASADPTLRDRVRDLDVLFGDGRALDEVRRLALDEAASLDARRAALRTLIEGRPPDLRPICEQLVRVRFLNAVAVRGLALFDDPAIGRTLAASYRSFHPSERPVALDVLASRPSFARALLDRIAAGAIPRAGPHRLPRPADPQPGRPGARPGGSSEVWGELRDSPADRRERIATLKAKLDPAALAGADRSRGRAVFERVCASCHKLYGHGGEIGPDLTGAGRDNLDYLLENLVDPSASVSADFRMVVVAMSDGRVLNGLVRRQTDRTLTLQTQTEALTLDREEIEEVKPSPLSLMPEGLLDPLGEDEVRDLIAYLMHRTQVPLPQPER